VAAQQGKSGSGVIEFCRVPFTRCVALIAFLPVKTAVNVLKPVAGNTSCRRILVMGAGMAGAALGFDMGAGQGKLCLAVIEGIGVPSL
jgi:hypothetical protein